MPLAFITQTAETKPSWLLSKAIFVPSGENSGSALFQMRLVSGVKSEPSAFMT